MSDTPTNFRQVFAGICNGYSTTSWDNKKVFIKHLSHFDQVDIESEREKYYEIARKKKIPSLAEKLDWLDKHNLWTKKNEADLQNQKVYLDNLYKTRKLLFISAQIKEHDKTIAEAEKKFRELSARKHKLIDKTCEEFADQKMQTFYIFISFYKDSSLKEKFFTYKEYEKLDEDEIMELMDIYLDFAGKFSHSGLKKIALLPFFTSYFYLSEEIYQFFGKPLAFLTYYQANLLSYGLYFKHIFQHESIPDNIKEDPDAIEDYINKAKKMKEAVGKAGKRGEGGRTGIVGASKEDMAIIGGNSGNTLLKQASKMGGISNINDAVRLSNS